MASIFRFKQFDIDQHNASMKICTDSCLFGALINVENKNNILDIGTGCGLLALMIAQKSDAFIHAIEPDLINATLAEKNFHQSPWNNRLRIFHQSLQKFALTTSSNYDLIVCNPPFYNSYFLSGNERQDRARHTCVLTHEELICSSAKLLNSDGSLWVMLPLGEMKLFEEIALQKNLHVQERYYVKHNPFSRIIRMVVHFAFSFHENVSESEISVRTTSNQYHCLFKNLMRTYYTIF